MVDLIKGWIGMKKNPDDDIPEVHLNKNEPKYSFDPVKKKWIIEGEVQEEEKPKLPPPKLKGGGGKSGGGAKKMANVNRYANIFGDSSIVETPKVQEQSRQENVGDTDKSVREGREKVYEREVDIDKLNGIETANNGNNVKDSYRGDNDQPATQGKHPSNNRLKNFFETPIKGREIKDDPDLFSEIENKDEQCSFLRTDDIKFNYQTQTNVSCVNIMSTRDSELKRIKTEFLGKISKMESDYIAEISDLKENLQFYEENYEESTTLLKNQINNFIRENLELKSNYEKAKDEWEYKKQEVIEYQKLFEHYKTLVDGTTSTPLINNPWSVSKSFDDEISSTKKIDGDFVYVNSKIEKWETEKIILNNDIIEWRGENEAMKIERQWLSSKVQQVEEHNVKLKNDVETLCIKLNEQGNSHTAWMGKNQNWKNQINSWNNQVTEMSLKVKEYSASVIEMNELNKEISQDLETKDEMILKAQETMDSLHKEIVKLNKEKEAIVIELTIERDDLIKANEEKLNALCNCYEEEIKAMKSDFERENEKIATANKDEINRLLNVISEKEGIISEYEKEIQRMKISKEEEHQTQLREAIDKVNNEKNNEINNIINQHQSEISRINMLKDKEHEEITKSFKEEIQELNQRKAADEEAFKVNIDKIRNSFQETEKTNQMWHKNAQEMQIRINELEEINKEYIRNQSVINNKKQNEDNVNSYWWEQYQRLHQENELKNEELFKYENEVREWQSTLSRFNSVLVSLDNTQDNKGTSSLSNVGNRFLNSYLEASRNISNLKNNNEELITENQILSREIENLKQEIFLENAKNKIANQ